MKWMIVITRMKMTIMKEKKMPKITVVVMNHKWKMLLYQMILPGALNGSWIVILTKIKIINKETMKRLVNRKKMAKQLKMSKKE